MMAAPAAVRKPALDEIRAAAERLRGVIVRTPLVPLHGADGGPPILLKPEVLQPTGSFKVRGVYNAVASLPAETRRRGLSTVSAGNTAQALAWAARRHGVAARSVMPQSAPRSKVEAVEAWGAEPVLVPTEAVFRYLREHQWESEPYAFIHPWIDRDVMIGHATLGLELVEDCPDVERVFVPVGGGGLMAGVAAALRALRPSVAIVAVEPEGCPALHASVAAGRPQTVRCETMCDGVAVPYITHEMFPLLAQLVDDVVLVSEDDVRGAVRRLAARNKLIAEPSGALALAAAQSQRKSAKTICIVTGGNVDAGTFAAILAASRLP